MSKCRYSHLAPVACLALLLAAASQAADLFVDAWRAPGLADQLISHPEQLKRFARVHVTAFSNGTLLGPTGSEPFACQPAPAGDVVTRLTRACRAAGVQVCWYLDLLRWERAGLPSPGLREPLAEVWERNLAGQPGGKDETALYASPWHPRTREILGRLLRTLAAWEPQPDGLTVSCRLTRGELLGYSDKARRATILALGVDPVDPMERPVMVKWYHQREDDLTELVTELAQAYHALRPNVPFHGLCTGVYANSSPGLRLYPADCGFRWAQRRVIDSLLLDGAWWEGSLAADGFHAHQLWSKSEAETKPELACGDRVYAAIGTRDNNGKLRLTEQMEALTAQHCGLDRTCFQPSRDGDLALVLAAMDEAAAAPASPAGAGAPKAKP
ncbi:MAG: hypothetical protein HZB16_15745 [Armatimonadetes bacterium]|nr:hypothetical protein [Armatimonadota bacterium]